MVEAPALVVGLFFFILESAVIERSTPLFVRSVIRHLHLRSEPHNRHLFINVSEAETAFGEHGFEDFLVCKVV